MVARPCDRESITIPCPYLPDADDDEHTDSDLEDDDQSQHRNSEIDIQTAIQILTDLVNELTDTEEQQTSSGQDSRQSTAHGSETDRSARLDEYHVHTYRSEDELRVVADLPGVGEDELFVGIDRELPALIVVVNETIVDHVSLPENAVDIREATLKNGVLFVRIRLLDHVTAA
ncbi:gas vesicle protein GvpH [Haladaptatus sp. NG-SE-30]